MREIKFKFWDIDNKVMSEVCKLGDDLRWLHSDMHIPLQCTGLRDKYGIEIYIGDILQTSNSHEEFDNWKKEDYGYTVCKTKDKELGFEFTNWYPRDKENSVYDLMFVEVVGNIYENYDLLK